MNAVAEGPDRAAASRPVTALCTASHRCGQPSGRRQRCAGMHLHNPSGGPRAGTRALAALLLTSITGSTQARREGVAAIAAASLSEYIHLNPVAIDRFMAPPQNLSSICAGETQCTPEQQADYDFRLWQLELADSIQNARGLVCRDGTPEDGVEGNAHCDGTGPLVIKIFWHGQGATELGESNQHRFTLQVS